MIAVPVQALYLACNYILSLNAMKISWSSILHIKHRGLGELRSLSRFTQQTGKWQSWDLNLCMLFTYCVLPVLPQSIWLCRILNKTHFFHYFHFKISLLLCVWLVSNRFSFLEVWWYLWKVSQFSLLVFFSLH